MKSVLSFLLIMLMALSACGPAYTCADPLGCVEIHPGDPIVIGTLLATNGTYGPDGAAAEEAVQQALTEQGTLLGHPLDLDRAGTDCTSDSARSAATGLVTDSSLVAVIGITCPEDEAAAAPILSDAGVALLAPAPDAATARELTVRLFAAIEDTAVRGNNGTVTIPRQALQDAFDRTP